MKIVRIFEYSSSFYTLAHWRTNVRIYSYRQIWHERISEYIRIKKITRTNVRIHSYEKFDKKKLHKRISEYIRIRKFDTNKCPNKYLWPKYLNIRKFKYIRHTLTRSQARSQLNAASLESSRCDNNIHIFIDFYWKIVNQLFPSQVPIPCYASWFYSWEWLVAAWNWNGSMPSVQMRALDVQDHVNDEHS